MTIDAPLPPGPDANVRGENPYVGPVPLSDGQKLYGRERETDELVDLIVSKRVVLLLSPSGAGKTSLIQAALAPALRELYELQPLPIIRLGYFCPDWGTAAITNRYRLAMLRALERRLPAAEQLTDQALAEYSLARYFQQRLGPTPPGEVSRYWLLIIDQFEELLTVNPLDEEDKRAFLDELGALLAGLDADDGTQVPIWALFAMREDRVAELEPYLWTSFRPRWRTAIAWTRWLWMQRARRSPNLPVTACRPMPPSSWCGTCARWWFAMPTASRRRARAVSSNRYSCRSCAAICGNASWSARSAASRPATSPPARPARSIWHCAPTSTAKWTLRPPAPAFPNAGCANGSARSWSPQAACAPRRCATRRRWAISMRPSVT
ncbi:ATP-binding protein [Lysobacter arenosi]|uniref:ATP-binding protein n=1 Tax=Lysobacter arenosi TaxID=2795387 RepID=A0ABX7R7F7_9GAMM|nr:ATP-binding protein [Lysobacter arenosi]QSX73675.1 ATP-binding protein [Lysobacter arenosi]